MPYIPFNSNDFYKIINSHKFYREKKKKISIQCTQYEMELCERGCESWMGIWISWQHLWTKMFRFRRYRLISMILTEMLGFSEGWGNFVQINHQRNTSKFSDFLLLYALRFFFSTNCFLSKMKKVNDSAVKIKLHTPPEPLTLNNVFFIY